MDELDEIAQLEASGQKLMAEAAPPPRKRETADAKRASTAGRKPLAEREHLAGRSPRGAERQPITEGDSAHVESLLAEIRDRLDLLLQANGSSQGANPSQGSLPENLPVLDTSVPTADETDELRKAFPHEDAGPPVAALPGAALPATAPANIMISDQDMTRLLATVEDRVTRHALTHHSSVVVLLGWAMALLAAGLGMGYGYIVASGRYPFWEPTAHAGFLPRISAAYLGAPVGVVLLPLAGAIIWAASKEASDEKYQAIWRLAAIGVFLAGILLPLTTML
ncbi:hypothetical protein Lferr_0241 [Acidithiobacillus ferrooxidans ATCC 53993]|uniref:tripartite tricarboxylate transporter TctB family protein n=1 Tax=Acidithiobacillus ferrooxidans TaxID=920 RepID=UPI00017F6D51|nr:tripartite tricarboxylate transporter TctB family protein [Acidithiobacillus ferrooxidans]ACH82499.1 hypothetical protein Lferr_0241 [Acidithiobacillus ferrooxidans ATCC 53993]